MPPDHTLCDLGLVTWLLQVSVCDGVLPVFFISCINCLQRRLPNAHHSGTHIRKKGLLPGYKEAQRPTAHPRSHRFMFPTVLKRKALIRAPSELFVTPLPKHLYLRLVGGGPGRTGVGRGRSGMQKRGRSSSLSAGPCCAVRGVWTQSLLFHPARRMPSRPLVHGEGDEMAHQDGNAGPRPSLLSGCQPPRPSHAPFQGHFSSPLDLPLCHSQPPEPQAGAPSLPGADPRPTDPSPGPDGQAGIAQLSALSAELG